MEWFKDKIVNNKMSRGIWLSTGSSVIAELAGNAGFDWALIDMEHGYVSEKDMLSQLQALRSTGCHPILRVPQNINYLVKRALDFGVSAVMCPMINTAQEAEEFVSSMKYPPQGRRGLTDMSRACSYGYDFKNYFEQANDKLMTIVQVETLKGIENVEAIAAVDGIDLLFLGHADLTVDMGIFGGFDSEQVKRAEDSLLSACKKNKKIAGMLIRPSMTVAQCLDKGFSFLGMGSDLGCLKDGFESLLSKQ